MYSITGVKRRCVAIFIVFCMILSTLVISKPLVVHAASESATWTKINLTDITSTDEIAITMTSSAGVTYLMSNNNGTEKAPTAVVGTLSEIGRASCRERVYVLV